MNITLLLAYRWACGDLSLAGDILPGSLPDIIMFDAVIMVAVCGLSYFIKARSFNILLVFSCYSVSRLIAVQICHCQRRTPLYST